MKRFYQFIKFCFYSTIFFIVLGIVGLVYIYNSFVSDLPQLDSLKDYNPPVISEVYSDNGTKVGEYWVERRILLSPQEIPKVMEQAIISSEDASFFEHSGIDYFGIARAMIENIKAGHIVQGGSTITQQVVKSFLLTKDRTWERKIKEAILAKRLEDRFSKKEILYLYLNQIYFGNRAYGIEAAAQNYFHKPAREINIAEAAMIAGLAKAPTMFSPIRNYSRAVTRQEYVIDRMFEEGFIDRTQLERAKNYKLIIYKAHTDKEFNMKHAPWFVEEVRRILIETYGKNMVYKHGLKIYTTLDLEAQNLANKALHRGLSELHKRHGYNGVLKHIPESEYRTFVANTHKKMYLETVKKNLVIRDLTDEKIAKINVKIKKYKTYTGLVTLINKQERSITVTVGQHIGKIISRDFGWARKRNNDRTGYDDIMYVKQPQTVAKVGDVVEIRVVDYDKLSSKKKKYYQPDQLYFTLEETPQIEGAVFSYDPHSGHVKAVIGGKDFSKSEFNRATQALRQPGSVFKPILYSAALDKGYRPDTVINDEPLRIPDGPGRYWAPRNYGGGFRGPMSFRSALIASRNVVSVRIILDVGVDYITALMRKLGFTTNIAKVYSMALGSNDVKLYEVTRAFGIFPTGGILPQYIFIKKMTDRYGNIIEQNQPTVIKNFQDQIEEGKHVKQAMVSEMSSNADNLRKDLWTDAQRFIKRDYLMLSPFEEIVLYGRHIPEGYVMNPKTVNTMVSIMQDIVNFGTGYRVKSLGRPVAGKTGTTNDQTDCWFVGYTPNIVTGVWTGYDQARNKVGAGETGGKAAAPIFLYYMKEYLKGTPVAKFNITKDMQYAELDPVIEIMPGNVSDLFTDIGASGGADFFADDI